MSSSTLRTPFPSEGSVTLRTDLQELTIDSLVRLEWAESMGRDAYGLFVDTCLAGVVQRWRWIVPGEFTMGSPPEEAERLNNERQHQVILSQGFWLADTACTQALWQAVMGNNPSSFKGEERPVENVSWEQVQRLLDSLNTPATGPAPAAGSIEERHSMKYHFFRVPAAAPEENQEAVNRFCAAHRVVSVDKQFVPNGEQSYWALCVGYLEPETGSPATRKGKVDYREMLNEQDFALFARLRDLRKTLAEKEGVPAYALFTKEQLATMVQQRVTSKAALSAIDGVGAARAAWRELDQRRQERALCAAQRQRAWQPQRQHWFSPCPSSRMAGGPGLTRRPSCLHARGAKSQWAAVC